MKFPRSLPTLVALVVALPLMTATASSAPDAPLAVLAAGNAFFVEVGWLPSSSPVDYYNVYGVTESGGLELLATAQVALSVVPSGYHAYGVSAVRAGVESDVTKSPDVPCIRYGIDPPDLYVEDCGVAGYFDVRLP